MYMGGTSSKMSGTFIQSFLRDESSSADLVIGVKGSSHNADTPLVLMEQKPNDFSQLFKRDSSTKSIRPVVGGNLCVTASGGKLVLKPYTGSKDQRWNIAKEYIINEAENQVWAVGGRTHVGKAGDECVAEAPTWKDNQKWKENKSTSFCYFIESRQYEGMVIDVAEGNTADGAEIIIWPPHPEYHPANQLFYTDEQTNTIRSALAGNRFCLTGTPAGIVKVRKYQPGQTSQTWKFNEEGRLHNVSNGNLVIAIKKGTGGSGGKRANLEVVDKANISHGDLRMIEWNVKRL